MHTTPISLLQQLREPDPQAAWERFVDLYTPLLYLWAVRARLPADDAADLVQDVLTTVVQQLPTFDYGRGDSFRGWLKTIALNRCRDLCRRQKVRANAGAGPLATVAAPDAFDALWEAEYLEKLIARASEIVQPEFEPSTWKAFWSVTIEGHKPRAVAAALGMTEAAVYQAKSRVLRRLREELAGLLD